MSSAYLCQAAVRSLKFFPQITKRLKHIVSVFSSDAAGRGRTGTGITTHGILSPGRLPIPPLRQLLNCYPLSPDMLIRETTQKRLELSTSAVTGRRSNQLSHWAIKWTFGDSNPGPTGYEPVALTN